MTEPKYFNHAAVISENKKLRKNTANIDNHLIELSNLKTRLKKVGSWQNRKKNIYDPLANPVWFIENKNRDIDSKKLVDLSSYDKKIKEKT